MNTQNRLVPIAISILLLLMLALSGSAKAQGNIRLNPVSFIFPDSPYVPAGFTGTQPFSYTWKKGTRTLISASEADRLYSLFTYPTRPSTAQAGFYELSITNSEGTFTAKTEVIIVSRQNRHYDTLLDAGQTFSTRVSLSGGKGSTFRWIKNEADLPTDNPRLIGVNSPSLTIKRVEATDTGSYACRVTYRGHSEMVAFHSLDVPGAAPEANEDLGDLYFTLGTPIEVTDDDLSDQVYLPEAGTLSSTPTSYSYSGLPRGLRFSKATGVISGTPLEAGVFPANLTLTRACLKTRCPAELG